VTTGPIAVIGLGDPDHADLAVGIQVVRALSGRVPPDVVLLEDGDPLTVLEQWEKFGTVILVDVVRSGSPLGTVQVFDGRHLPPLVRAGILASHGFSMREIIGVGEALGTLSKTVRVIGIEGPEFSPGLPLAPEVEVSVAAAVDAVLGQISLLRSSIQ
jgi:hydrogenase maturation protease